MEGRIPGGVNVMYALARYARWVMKNRLKGISWELMGTVEWKELEFWLEPARAMEELTERPDFRLSR